MTDPVPEKVVLGADLTSFLEDPPSVLVYGSPGTGKSTDLFLAFPNSLWLLSAKGVLRPVASYIRDNPKAGYAMPLPLFDEDTGKPNEITLDRKNGVTRFKTPQGSVEYTGLRRGAYIVIPEFINSDTRFNNWAKLVECGNAFVARCQADPSRYDALIVDELSAFSTRTYEDIKADRRFFAKSGNLDVFKANSELHVFHRWLGKFIPPAAKKAVLVACHASEPKYHDKDGDPREGQLKYMGGPKLPIGTLIDSITADMDIVLHLTMEMGLEGRQRVYHTAADPLWVRKFRDFTIGQKEPIGLRALLVRAGYAI